MTDLTPAQELLAASDLLDEHLGHLELHDVRGPWTVHAGPTGYPQTVSNVGVPILIANTFTDPKAPPVTAHYIALMGPTVGKPLAKWLRDAARDDESNSKCPECHGECCVPRACTCVDAALAVARAILTGGGQ